MSQRFVCDGCEETIKKTDKHYHVRLSVTETEPDDNEYGDEDYVEGDFCVKCVGSDQSALHALLEQLDEEVKKEQKRREQEERDSR